MKLEKKHYVGIGILIFVVLIIIFRKQISGLFGRIGSSMSGTRSYHGGGRSGGGAGIRAFSIGNFGNPYQYPQVITLYDANGNAINPQPNERAYCKRECLSPYPEGSQYAGYYFCNVRCLGSF